MCDRSRLTVLVVDKDTQQIKAVYNDVDRVHKDKRGNKWYIIWDLEELETDYPYKKVEYATDMYTLMLY